MSDDQVGVEAEMEKWKKVAKMIGVTLDDVCNMAEAERSALVLLAPIENNGKDNVDPAEDLVNVQEVSDGEDNSYGKPFETPEKVKVMVKRCDLNGVLGGNICNFSFNSPASTNLNESINSVLMKVTSWNSKFNTTFLGTFQPIATSNDYFNAMEKNPQNFRLDKKCASLVSLEKADSSSLRDIYQGFKGIKFVKSQGVCTGQEDPGLVSIGPDNSVKNGFAAVKKKSMERGSIEESTSSSSSHGPLPQSANFGAGVSDALTPKKHMSNTSKSSVERKVIRTEICPLCLQVQWINQLEMHAAECSGDTAEAGSNELCSGCLKLIPIGTFKDHSLRCNGD